MEEPIRNSFFFSSSSSLFLFLLLEKQLDSRILTILPWNLQCSDMLYDDKNLKQAYDKIETLDYHQQKQVKGIKFTAYTAGHVLGAAMFLIEIAGVKLLYTGDYSREEDRHLCAAELPPTQPDILVCESTYGTQSHEPRLAREHRFTSTFPFSFSPLLACLFSNTFSFLSFFPTPATILISCSPQRWPRSPYQAHSPHHPI